jgi:neurexin
LPPLIFVLDVEQVDGHIFVAYNPGSHDNVIGEMNTKVNDGRYHVVRFTRDRGYKTILFDVTGKGSLK